MDATLFANMLQLVTEAKKAPTVKTDQSTQSYDRPLTLDQAVQTTPTTPERTRSSQKPTLAQNTPVYKRARQYSSDSSSSGKPQTQQPRKSTPWHEDMEESEAENAAALTYGQSSANSSRPSTSRQDTFPRQNRTVVGAARLTTDLRPLTHNVADYTGPMQIRGQNVMVLPKLPGCWNCGARGHRYPTCQLDPQVFCHRCGLWGVYVFECPKCSTGWHSEGPWVPSVQSHVPRDVRLPRREEDY